MNRQDAPDAARMAIGITPRITRRHCDIVADRPAVILEIAAYEGTPKVKAGDVVKEGQVLIEGSFFRNEEEEPRYVSARGKILGRVWYSASATASLEAVRTEPTGNEYTVRTMELGGWEVDLTEEPPPYEEYTVEEVSRTPVVGSFFPAQVITKRYREVTVVTEQKVTVEEARRAISSFPGDILADDLSGKLYPMPLHSSDKDEVLVGRIREDLTEENGLSLFCCGDQLRKGAASNAVQIAQLLIR